MNTADFSINLEDGTSSAAADAAGALESLRSKIDGDTKALREMERAMKNLQRGTSVNIAQFRELQAKIEAKRQSIAGAQAEYLSLGGTFDRVRKKTRDTGQQFSALEQAAARMPGPLGAFAGGLAKMQAASGAARLLLLKVAMVALTVAVVAGAAALTRYGIASAEARRSEALQLEGLSRLRDWYGRTADSGAFLQQTVDKVAGSTAVGRAQLVQYTDQLYRMGLRAGNLETALEGVAIVAATQGDAQARVFMSMAAGAQRAQGGVKRLTDDAKARLGGLANAQLLGLSVQTRKLRENFSGLFDDLKIEGLLRSLKSVTDLFSQNTQTGRALKELMTTLVQPLVNGLETAGPIVKRFFQGMVISALLITIGVLKIRNALRDAFGSDNLKGLDAANVALAAGVTVGLLLTAVMAALAIKVAIVTFPIWGTVAALVALFAIGVKVGEWFASVDWSGLGKSIIDGLVNGIKGGAKWVKDAVVGLANAVARTFREKLEIFSPSRVMRRFGVHVAEGPVVGIDSQLPAVERASERLADAVVPDAERAAFGGVPTPELPARQRVADAEPAATPAAPHRGGTPARAPVQVTFHDGAIQIQTAATDAAGLAEELEGPLAALLQGALTELGGAPA